MGVEGGWREREEEEKKHKNSSQGVLTRICWRIIENHVRGEGEGCGQTIEGLS